SLRSDDALISRQNGTTFPAACALAPIETHGEVVGAVLTFQDVTERKREEEALRRLSEQRASMVSTVSHALRAPLAATMVNIEVLEDGILGDLNAEQQEYLMRAMRSMEQLSETVDDLLTISRLQDGRMSLRAEPLDPAEFLS